MVLAHTSVQGGMENKSDRLVFIDVARTYAVILALLTHALETINLFDQLGSDSVYIRQFTRMATPMFVFMFGFMVELVYVKRVEQGQSSVSKWLYIRSFQCYVAYALTSLSAYLGGYKEIEDVLASLVFLSNAHFGNILRVYCIILLLTPIIINIRIKHGIKSLYFFVTLLLIVLFYLPPLQSFDFNLAGRPLNILFGIGNNLGGPSIVGALVFYFSGMITASSLRSNSSKQLTFNFYKQTAILLIFFLIAGWVLISDTPKDAWTYFSDFTYRKHNAPAYFIIGTICSLIVIATLAFIFERVKVTRFILYLLPIGTSSLISYTLGNVILNIFGQYAGKLNLFLFLLLFLFSVVFITRHHHKIPFYQKIKGLMNLEYRKVFQRTSG